MVANPGGRPQLMAQVEAAKAHLAAGRDAGIVQIFQNLGLRIDRVAFSAGEFLEIDTVTAAFEAQLDPIVDQALGLHALAHAHLRKQVDRSLLQHAGADTLLDILTTAIFDYDGVNSLQMQEVREDQTGWPGADDSDLSAL